MRRVAKAWLLVAASCSCSTAAAFDSSISGYGTIGFARSDKPYAYQRFVDKNGSLRRDSVLGLQVDTKLSDGLSATVQVKAEASQGRDTGVDAKIAWAFLSYRPNNDWFVRAGKFRAPLYLRSETQDVGTTFDQATLPVEVYSQSPTSDFKGLSVSRSWSTPDGDLVLDAHWGTARTSLRVWFRDALPIWDAGAHFLPLTVNIRGLAVTAHRNADTFRAAFSSARVESRTPLMFAEPYPFIPIPGLPGVGYYDTLEGILSGRVPVNPRINIPVYTLGADVAGPYGLRVVAEYGRRIVKNTLGYDSKGAYASFSRRMGAWTPYFTYAFLQSTQGDRAAYSAVNVNRVPDFVPGAALINLLQRSGADGSVTFDQRSMALGVAHSVSPTAKFKAEIQRVRIGEVSALVDAPPGSDIRQQSIRLLSISFSAVF